jgi:hypothetical protein
MRTRVVLCQLKPGIAAYDPPAQSDAQLAGALDAPTDAALIDPVW